MKEDEPKPDIKIVEYSDEYRDQVRDVIGKTLADIEVIDPATLPIDDPDLDNIEKEYSGNGRFWVALREGKVVGTVGVRDGGNQVAKLKRMFVLVDQHGSGIGQQLLDTAIDFAEMEGFKKMVLNTHEKMQRAHKFYERNGFLQTDKTGDKIHYEKNLLSTAKAINNLRH